LSILDETVVVTVRKGFWASTEAQAFPHRIYARVFFGHSTNLLNSLVVACRALLTIVRRRPKVVVLGSVERTVPWFIRARRLGLLGKARLVVTNQLHLTDEQLEQVDGNLVYSHAWIDRQRPLVRERAFFVPLPADGDLGAARRSARGGGYVFAGGGAGRDFRSVIEAVRGLDSALRIVTFSAETLGWEGELPANVAVEWLMPVQSFVERVAAATVVVVPLRDPDSDFGQTTLVQALGLGRAVVATRSPGVVDYVEDGREGFLVDAGDVEAYRDAILRLCSDDELRARCEQNAAMRARELTYSAFGERLETICTDLADGL
jgi:glycosyltransferase involved in cell wall biosynthesis